MHAHTQKEGGLKQKENVRRTIFWPLSTSFQKPYRHARLASAEKEATPSSCVRQSE